MAPYLECLHRGPSIGGETALRVAPNIDPLDASSTMGRSRLMRYCMEVLSLREALTFGSLMLQ
jgi:hypothetical protein